MHLAESPHTLGLGFSSCPNDTFMFHALVHGLVAVPGPGPVGFRCVIDDIEALNERALASVDALEISKLSANVLGHVTERYYVLPSGAALGRGCGPLVVTRRGAALTRLSDLAARRIAVPGMMTTAYLLLRLFAPESVDAVPMRFDAIMAAVASGEVDAGVVIHEGRFTYEAAGLQLIADLGECWEADTDLPLPLGVICAQRSLNDQLVRGVASALSASVEYAYRHPEASRAYIAGLAQELAPDVCARHIALYVNAFSRDLGEVGRAAIETLLARGRAVGVLPGGGCSPWRD